MRRQSVSSFLLTGGQAARRSVLVLTGSLLVASCSKGDDRPAGIDEDGESTNKSSNDSNPSNDDDGNPTNGDDDTGPDARVDPSDGDRSDAGIPDDGEDGDGDDASIGDAGTDPGAADETPVVCGDGVVQAPEQCDEGSLDGLTCVDFGYESGDLNCDACSIDFDDCSGTEQCFDGRDNDGDRLDDCEDDDCAEACAQSCDAPVALADPARAVAGDTSGHAAVVASDACAASAEAAEVVYRFQAATTGVVDISLATERNLNLSVRSNCDDGQSELACTFNRQLKLPVTANDVLFIVVDGADENEAGAFLLSAESRSISCGDGRRDGDEECDDGNQDADDGCSDSCALESTESEPNDDLESASSFSEPYFAHITEGDEDFIAIEVESSAATLIVDTFDFGDGSCDAGDLDSELFLLDGEGTTLASDDDGGQGLCAHAVATDLAAGTYYARVRASSAGETPEFVYRLGVAIDVCGNGSISEVESCDDGNTTSGDACSSTCQAE